MGFSQGWGRGQGLGNDMAHLGSTQRLNHIVKWRTEDIPGGGDSRSSAWRLGGVRLV